LQTTLPQSVNLEFETGVAADTLVFGSVRWVDWTQFEVAPIDYTTLTKRPLVYYNDDVFTYNLGVGRRFSENWAGAVSVTYEEQIGGYSLNLGPSDGLASINLGGTYTQGPMEISAGLSYFWIGDAKTFTTDPTVTAANFDDNTGVGFGMRVAYRF
jgi:long-subunit fatty acid transport protein